LGPCGTFAVPFELHSMCAMSRGRVIVPFMFRQGTKIDVLKYIGNIITSLGVFWREMWHCIASTSSFLWLIRGGLQVRIFFQKKYETGIFHHAHVSFWGHVHVSCSSRNILALPIVKRLTISWSFSGHRVPKRKGRKGMQKKQKAYNTKRTKKFHKETKNMSGMLLTPRQWLHKFSQHYLSLKPLNILDVQFNTKKNQSSLVGMGPCKIVFSMVLCFCMSSYSMHKPIEF